MLTSGQINMRKDDGWQTLATNPLVQPIPPLEPKSHNLAYFSNNGGTS
jgi:hypothetical protein